MDRAERKFRGLLYVLTDLQSELKSAARSVAAEMIWDATRLARQTPLPDFLQDCRKTLDDVLLGERDLPGPLIGQLLDAIAMVDEMMLSGESGMERHNADDSRH